MLKFVNSILKRPKLYLFTSLFFIALIFTGLAKLQSDFSVKIWFSENHPVMENVRENEKLFGGMETVILGLKVPKSSVDHLFLKDLTRLTEELGEIKGVSKVESIANTNNIFSDDDSVSIYPFSDYFDSVSEFKKYVNEQISDLDHIIRGDLTYFQFIVSLLPDYEGIDEFKRIQKESLEVFKRYQNKKETALFQSGSILSHINFAKSAQNDNMVMIPISFLVILIFLFFIFRSFLIVLLPVILAIITILASFSIMGIWGIKHNNMLGALPGILLAICLADCIHIISSFLINCKKGDSLEAIRKALKSNLVPTLLTSISTIVSFLSIAQTQVRPIRDLGVMVAIGTLLAWILSYTLIGSLIVIFRDRLSVKKEKSFSLKRETWENYLRWIGSHRKKIIFSFAALTLTSVYYSLQLKVDSDPISYFAEDNQFRRDSESITKQVDFKRTVELIVDSKELDGIKKLEFLKKQQKLIRFIKKLPEVKTTKSVEDLILRMNLILTNSSELPTNQEAVAQLLLLYEISSEFEYGLGHFIDQSSQYSKIKIFWDIKNVSDSSKRLNEIFTEAKKLGLDVKTGGDFPVYISIVESIVKTLTSSIGLAIFLLLILVFLVFRDVKISMVAMLPNLIPVAFSGLLVYSFGLFLDIGTSMIATITLGIAIDDTIHFVTKYQKGMRKFSSTPLALRYALEMSATALISTTIVLCCGFGVFAFAEFLPNQRFGVLTSICILVALVTDLVLLPAILLGKEKVSFPEQTTQE